MLHMGFGSRRPRLQTRWNVLWGDVLLLILVYVYFTFYKLSTWILQIRYLCDTVKPD